MKKTVTKQEQKRGKTNNDKKSNQKKEKRQ
jgi:hypothetical protein